MANGERERKYNPRGYTYQTVQNVKRLADDIIEGGGLFGLAGEQIRRGAEYGPLPLSELGAFDRAAPGVTKDLVRQGADIAKKAGAKVEDILFGLGAPEAEQAAGAAAAARGRMKPPPMLEEPAPRPSAIAKPPGASGRTFTLPGPDYESAPGPPPLEPGPTPYDPGMAQEWEKVFEEMRPEAPEARKATGPGGTWTGWFGDLARGMASRGKGASIGELFAGAGAAAAGGAEERVRYDAAEQRKYEQTLRAWEANRLNIKDQYHLRQQAARDAAAQTDYKNKVRRHAYDYEQWQNRQPKINIQGGAAIVSQLNDAGQYEVTSQSLNPIDDYLRQAKMRMDIAKTFGMSSMEVLNREGEAVAMSTVPPQYQLPALFATSVHAGDYAPDVKRAAIQKVLRSELAFRAEMRGLDPANKDDMTLLYNQFIQEQEGEDWQKTLEPRIIEKLRNYALTHPEAVRAYADRLPNLGFGGLLVGEQP